MPRLLPRTPARIAVLTKRQFTAILRMRAALKQAQRERSALMVSLKYTTLADGVTHRTILRPAQRKALDIIALQLRKAAFGLYLFQNSIYGAYGGTYKQQPLPPLEPPDKVDPWRLAVRNEQLEAENRQLRKLVHVKRRAGWL